jgi:hypothetical protein
MGWMKAMGAKIAQPQMADPKVKTIADVALLITNNAGKSTQRLTGAEFPRARIVDAIQLIKDA